jgi:hypothetical protein
MGSSRPPFPVKELPREVEVIGGAVDVCGYILPAASS